MDAPFVSSVMHIEPQWIDYNGHLNVAYYNVLFDRAVDEAYELVGLGPSYLERHGHSTMVAESHVHYLRELRESDPVKITVQLIDYDAKRIQIFERLLHATEGWLSATCETMTVHVNMTTKKVAPFQESVLRLLAGMKDAHASLPQPEGLGRRVSMRPRANSYQ